MAFPPVADNKLNSLGVFVQRDFYDKNVYPTAAPNPIDLWYKKPLYGKVDKKNDSAYPSEAFLKQFKIDGKTLFAMNFVVDAFEDFKRQYERFLFQGKLETETSEFGELVPEEAWLSTNTLYHEYVSILFDVFNETFILFGGRNEEIIDFPSFLKVFIEWIDEINPLHPFTKTGFIQSKYCPPNVSGLMIKMQIRKHDEDEAKFEDFIDDGNFTFYSRMARRHGFIVDKNAPWVLVADLASPAMAPYLALNDITLDNLFQEYYYRAFEMEIEVLKVYVLQFYNSLVGASPSVKILKKGRGTRGAVTEIKLRKAITREQMDEQYPLAFWLRMITYIRARETSRTFTQSQYEQLVKQAIEIAKFVEPASAIEFLNRHFKNKLPLALRGDQTIKVPRNELAPRERDFVFI